MTKFPLQSFLFAAVLLVTVMVRSHMQAAEHIPRESIETLAQTASLEAAPSSAEQTTITIPKSTAATLAPPAIAVIPAEQRVAAPAPAIKEEGTTVIRTNVLDVSPEKKKIPHEELAITARVAMVTDLSSGELYVERESEKRWAIASLTKLFTAIVIAEAWEPEKKVIVTEHALAGEGDAGGLALGEIYTTRDLLALMLLTSSNDAAETFADAYGERALIDAMQAKARDIGMMNTAIADVSGISYLNQSTANDLELFARYLLDRHPELLALTAEGRTRIVEQKSGATRTITSIHPFAGRPHFIGGKTGYTEEARGNLFSLFRVDDRIFFILVLGSADRARDTQLLYGALTGG